MLQFILNLHSLHSNPIGEIFLYFCHILSTLKAVKYSRDAIHGLGEGLAIKTTYTLDLPPYGVLLLSR
jgi:hypothetical protein